MSESADDIIERMQHVRRDVSQDVAGIVETAKTLTDWRYHVKHHPWLLLGGAVALGFLVTPRKKKIPSQDAKELVALLKKHNVSVAAPAAPAKSLAHTMLGMAAPIVMRHVMGFAQQRFGAMPSGLGGMFAPRPERPEQTAHYEEFNIPR
jgi:hypothetical protein